MRGACVRNIGKRPEPRLAYRTTGTRTYETAGIFRGRNAEKGPRVGAPSPFSLDWLCLGEGSEVQLDDLGVVGELAAGAGVGVAALVEHVAAMADLQAAPGGLIHPDDRDAGLGD